MWCCLICKQGYQWFQRLIAVGGFSFIICGNLTADMVGFSTVVWAWALPFLCASLSSSPSSSHQLCSSRLCIVLIKDFGRPHVVKAPQEKEASGQRVLSHCYFCSIPVAFLSPALGDTSRPPPILFCLNYVFRIPSLHFFPSIVKWETRS